MLAKRNGNVNRKTNRNKSNSTNTFQEKFSQQKMQSNPEDSLTSLQNLSGVYTLSSGGETVNLILTQDSREGIAGFMRSTNGQEFQIKGIMQQGCVSGTFGNANMTGYFEAYPQESGVVFILIDMDIYQNSIPGSARQLTFTRISSGVPDPSMYQQPQHNSIGGQSVGSDLVHHFSGLWVGSSRNTERKVLLNPDGTYEMHYVGTWTGTFSDQCGNDAGNWGQGTAIQECGSWNVHGNKTEGTITTVDQYGNQSVYQYQVHIERGQVYWNEYFFDGVLFSKKL